MNDVERRVMKQDRGKNDSGYGRSTRFSTTFFYFIFSTDVRVVFDEGLFEKKSETEREREGEREREREKEKRRGEKRERERERERE